MSFEGKVKELKPGTRFSAHSTAARSEACPVFARSNTDRGFESQWRHGCLFACILCLRCPACRERPCDGLTPGILPTVYTTGELKEMPTVANGRRTSKAMSRAQLARCAMNEVLCHVPRIRAGKWLYLVSHFMKLMNEAKNAERPCSAVRTLPPWCTHSMQALARVAFGSGPWPRTSDFMLLLEARGTILPREKPIRDCLLTAASH
jgi:hypothetical protein